MYPIVLSGVCVAECIVHSEPDVCARYVQARFSGCLRRGMCAEPKPSVAPGCHTIPCTGLPRRDVQLWIFGWPNGHNT